METGGWWVDCWDFRWQMHRTISSLSRSLHVCLSVRTSVCLSVCLCHCSLLQSFYCMFLWLASLTSTAVSKFDIWCQKLHFKNTVLPSNYVLSVGHCEGEFTCTRFIFDGKWSNTDILVTVFCILFCFHPQLMWIFDRSAINVFALQKKECWAS